MEKSIQEQLDEEYLTDYTEIYKDYSLEQLQVELDNTMKLYKKSWDKGDYITINGVTQVPGSKKMREIVKLINEKAFEIESTLGIENEESVATVSSGKRV